MNSTNLAHTAPYCLHTSPGTMAERYHKNELQNSTVVLPCHTPTSKTRKIVIPLPDDLPFSELQKHRKKRLHLPIGWNGPKGDRQSSDPLNLIATRSSSVNSCFILYI